MIEVKDLNTPSHTSLLFVSCLKLVRCPHLLFQKSLSPASPPPPLTLQYSPLLFLLFERSTERSVSATFSPGSARFRNRSNHSDPVSTNRRRWKNLRHRLDRPRCGDGRWILYRLYSPRTHQEYLPVRNLSSAVEIIADAAVTAIDFCWQRCQITSRNKVTRREVCSGSTGS